MNAKELGYLIVTDYIEASSGKDVSDELQALILNNPQRTIYFPDGVYLISKPICTPANPAHSVSLLLSCYATIKATDDWTDTEALVRLGAAEPFNDINANGSNYYFEGGMHWLTGSADKLPLNRIWKETGALQENNPIENRDPVYTLVDGDKRLNLYRDLNKLKMNYWNMPIPNKMRNFVMLCLKNLM